MSIPRDFALDQVSRLTTLEFFPTNSDAYVKDLIEVLAESKTKAIAEAVVTEWLRENRERPTPADLYGMVRDHNAAASTKERESLPDCPRCNGVGQWIGSRLYRGEWISVAGKCEDCGGSGKMREKATA